MRAFTPSSPVPGGSSAGTRPVGVSTSVQRFRARNCGWFQTPCISLTEALAIAAWSNFSMTSAAFNLENTASISFFSSSRLATRAEFVENRGSEAKSPFPRTFVQKLANSRSFWIPNMTVPSPHSNGPYG